MMSGEELREMFAKQSKDMATMNSHMDKLYTKLDSITEDNTDSNNVVQTHMTDVQEQIRGLKSSIEDTGITFENRFVQLEGKFNQFQENALSSIITTKEDITDAVKPMIEEMVPKIKDEVKKDILVPLKAT